MPRKRVPTEQEGLFRKGRLFYGDNLTILKDIAPESVDLIYLDPPFNSKRPYNLIFSRDEDESPAQIHAFDDSWTWNLAARAAYNRLTGAGASERGVPAELTTLVEALHSVLRPSSMLAYIVMMAERLVALRRVLKPTGSLYLHCDPTASHYLRIVLDAVFGAERFRNEIVWKRANAHNDAERFGRVADSILFYAKTESALWQQQFSPYREEYYRSHYKQDENGRWFRTVPLDAPRHGAGSAALLYEWHGKLPAPSRTWSAKIETMREHERAGRLRYTKTGTPTLVQYADEMPGVPLQSIWTDIPPVNPQAKERIGWATQKPVALLERIIKSSCPEDGVVLDPFCGCGTAIEAAHRLGRRWIGIDVAHLAIEVIEARLDKLGLAKGIDYTVLGEPSDAPSAAKLATENPWEFQRWAIGALRAEHLGHDGKMKKGADRGIDGFIRFQDDPSAEKSKRVLVSVKGGKTGSKDVRDLVGTITREGAPIGVLVSMQEPTEPMRKEAAEAGFYMRDVPRIQLISIADFFRGRRPVFPGENRSRRSSRPPMPMIEAKPRKGARRAG